MLHLLHELCYGNKVLLLSYGLVCKSTKRGTPPILHKSVCVWSSITAYVKKAFFYVERSICVAFLFVIKLMMI